MRFGCSGGVGRSVGVGYGAFERSGGVAFGGLLIGAFVRAKRVVG